MEQQVKQLDKGKIILEHLYPGIIITIAFILLTPWVVANHYPPQFSLLLCVLIVALPVLLFHLYRARRTEHRKNIWQLNGYTNKLSTGKLIGYVIGLVVFQYVVWGLTQPLNQVIAKKFFNWLPAWYTTQDFTGYSKQVLLITLLLNLVLNGLIAPLVEEFYFRGYLLPRMQSFGKLAFVMNGILFSLYHLWQPTIYLTLIISMIPMSYLVWKTKDIRLGILAHCLLNLVGALLSFGLLNQ
jgi:membrane protease YdiL (CAAX protease family)